eukprot:TRINITY_DN712_c0_g1_i1.p1 TRINITY_DN712_c0_g1~~TRINITY_DN712_c0_g1_i1.p1  ORF type:complete len:1164 (-),score=423.48 TRINITY_DN712_c0_g1_i1:47-3538(-)
MPTFAPHNLKVGEKCWLIVGGEDKDNANVHQAEVTAIDGNKYTVTRKFWEDEVFDKNKEGDLEARMYEEEEVSGLSHLEGEFSERKVIDEGNGKATLCQMDANFRDGGYDDMVDMRKLNDAELCYNLRVRCLNKVPYCRCGVTLVAINLYEPISSYKPGGANEHIYSTATKEYYKAQTDRSKCPPHCWSLGSHCFKSLFERRPGHTGNNDQSIVITGESGAGKTFNTKQILDFLADLGATAGGDDAEGKITDLMLDATPILEGFGNANMPRNPDSSRFGKLYKIFFDKTSKTITGCSITPYMLEKSRVSSQQMCERNFHIFYRMIHEALPYQDRKPIEQVTNKIFFDGNMMGFSAEERERYHIRCYDDYVFLRGGTAQLENEYDRIYGDVPKGWKPTADEPGNGEPEGREYKDAANMAETKLALTKFFTDEQIDLIWRITSGCLWLGNVEYDGDNDKCNPRDSGLSKQALDTVAEMWMVDRDLLYKAMYVETIPIAGKDKECPRGLTEALTLRDSMARTTYERLFVWMVSKMSETLTTKDSRCKPQTQPFIGVLDIFGFEFYPDEALKPLGGKTMNTLDQFNINMCNEVLQGVFVDVIFKLEQTLYFEQVHEKIEIDFDVNDDTIQLMKDRKHSIIEAMDQVIHKKKSGKKGDQEFFDTLFKMHGDTKTKYGEAKTNASYRLDMSKRAGRKTYAQGGPYGYQTTAKPYGVPKELAAETPGIFRLQHYAANVTYDVRNWIDRDMDKLSRDSYDCLLSSQLPEFIEETFKEAAANSVKTTVARDFANSLNTLVATLEATECNFVRCLKASNPLASSVFKNALVLNQLKYTGMLDTLIIRRGGFPIRMEFQDFCDQYRMIAVNDADNAHTLAEALKARTENILSRLEEKPPVNQQQDPIRVGSPKKQSTVPLVLMRDWFARELDEEANIVKGKSAVIAQAATRMGFARYEYSRQIAARDIQAIARGAFTHAPYNQYRNCVLQVLGEARGMIARSVASQANEQNMNASNKAATVAFLQDNIFLVKREKEERAQARQEDDYATLISFARFGEKIVSLKEEAMAEGMSNYRRAIEAAAACNEVVADLAAKSAAADLRWAKMEEGGTVRSVPLVRQYKQSANRFVPPDKSVYKFRYLSLIHISEPTRLLSISYAVFCLKKKKKKKKKKRK